MQLARKSWVRKTEHKMRKRVGRSLRQTGKSTGIGAKITGSKCQVNSESDAPKQFPLVASQNVFAHCPGRMDLLAHCRGGNDKMPDSNSPSRFFSSNGRSEFCLAAPSCSTVH
ncbi:hypothetical protein RRG08_016680 [Elysia crispata]|uniref:Uncharacterized protein n=1 Tax=Elysia crispata TaxID=231223 RepID=A0AAE1E2M9_9GAST|nr:hypothetical protein RRG08_016680 [Elysia crispata]